MTASFLIKTILLEAILKMKLIILKNKNLILIWWISMIIFSKANIICSCLKKSFKILKRQSRNFKKIGLAQK